MKNRADLLSFCGLLTAFGSQGIITGFQPEIHDLVCFTPMDCPWEIRILAILKLVTGIAGIVSAYYLINKTSTPPGTTLAVVPHDQIPVTAPKNGINEPSYAPITPGSAGDPVSVTSPPKGP